MQRAIILKLAVHKYRLPYLDKVMLFNSQIRRPVACVVKRTKETKKAFLCSLGWLAGWQTIPRLSIVRFLGGLRLSVNISGRVR